MSHVELTRPLEAYFAHAELEGPDAERRFTITLPYFEGARLSRLQWWWSISTAQLRIGGEEGLAEHRRVATARFRQHVEHWLKNNGLRLSGDDPIPRLDLLARVIPTLVPDAIPADLREPRSARA
ncbi:MAG: hypothetical protein ABW136_09300 [Steroidobacteraceae bacterium]